MPNCYICGIKNATKPLVLKDSFTAHTRCKSPQSDKLCDRCYDCMDGKYKQCWYWHPTKQSWSKLWGRNWSWLICSDNNLCRPTFAPSPKGDNLLEVKNLPTRAEIREWVLNPPNPPFTICIATTGQKHTYPFAVEAIDRDLFPVLFEDTLIYCDRFKFIDYLRPVEQLLNFGFSKTEILTGDYNSQKIIQAGLIQFQIAETEISQARNTEIFPLVLHLAITPILVSPHCSPSFKIL